MRNKFNKVSGTQDPQLIKAHCAMMYACQTIAERGVTADEFMIYASKVFESVSDKIEWQNVMKLREQLVEIVADGFRF